MSPGSTAASCGCLVCKHSDASVCAAERCPCCGSMNYVHAISFESTFSVESMTWTESLGNQTVTATG
jgi:hypothetical protein